MVKPFVHHFLNNHRNLMLYGLIGAVGATLDFLVYLLLFSLLGVVPFLATFLSVSVGIINNFILNLRHNFKVEGKVLSRFINFYMTGVAGAIASSVLIYLLHDMMNVDAVLAKILTIPPIVLVQFYINKSFAFSKTRYINSEKSSGNTVKE